MASDFSRDLLEWYAVHARSMPWRVSPSDHAAGKTADPYRVWLSEVMLQQTQVVTVREYFLKFTKKWPTVHDLANADLEDVLKAWAGLGYYSRARNLKKCADKVVLEHNGRFPETYDGLKALPGIGDYTAAAIASIAFSEPVPVVDGNVERVISRYDQIETAFPAAKSLVRDRIGGLLDASMPGEFAQATMDLGATICTPKKPVCALCPVSNGCSGYKNGDQETYPRKAPKKQKPIRKGAAFVMVNSDNEIFLCKRPEKGLLGGMTQVPTTDWSASQDGLTGLEAAPIQAEWKMSGMAKHTFTHFHLELTVWKAANVEEVKLDGWWCSQNLLKFEALPTVMHKVLSATD